MGGFAPGTPVAPPRLQHELVAWQRAAHPGHPGPAHSATSSSRCPPCGCCGRTSPARGWRFSGTNTSSPSRRARFYADATRCIEYGPVAAFFARHADLDPELSEYFAGFPADRQLPLRSRRHLRGEPAARRREEHPVRLSQARRQRPLPRTSSPGRWSNWRSIWRTPPPRSPRRRRSAPPPPPSWVTPRRAR